MNNYFDKNNNAKDYIHMVRNYVAGDLIAPLRTHLPDGSTLLELGMGPGKDLDLLRKHYNVTGSDSAQAFLDIYYESHPHADVLLLDAVSIDTQRRFDGFYSNKVLMHLTQDALKKSFARQAEVLNPGGIALHSFWRGDREEDYDGLRFVYYQPETLLPLIAAPFEVLETKIYKESAKNDSFYIVLKKN